MHTGLIGTKMCKKFQKNNNILHLLAKIGSTVKQEFARFGTILPEWVRRWIDGPQCPSPAVDKLKTLFSNLKNFQHFGKLGPKTEC